MKTLFLILIFSVATFGQSSWWWAWDGEAGGNIYIDSLFGFWVYTEGVTGDPVSQWDDQATEFGANNPFVQATADARPDLQADGIHFDGVDDALGITAANSTEFNPGDGSLSVAFSYKGTDKEAVARLVSKYSNSTNPYWTINMTTLGKFYMVIRDGSANATGTSSTAGDDIADGEVHHIVGIINKDTDSVYLYVDGNLIDKVTIASVGTINSVGNLTIQSNVTNAWTIGYLAIFKKALTPAEVTAIPNYLGELLAYVPSQNNLLMTVDKNAIITSEGKYLYARP